MSDGAQIVDLDKERQSADGNRRIGETMEKLAKSNNGGILGILSNLILIIGNDPLLSSLCGHDDFQNIPVIMASPPLPFDNAPETPGPYPRSWTGADVAHIQSYIQRTWTREAKKGEVEDAMLAVAATRRFHPVRDWLASLKWDGAPRVNDWIVNTFGAKQTAYTAELARCILIAAVRRVRQPGVKFDHMVIFEGFQGKGKSTAIKLLFGESWFTDSLPAALEGRDAALALQGVWCVEFAEIEQIIRNELEIIKAFLSRSVDRFRAPYARQPLKYPRQSVMIGTTNETDYLKDASGNRRFWPIWCEKVDLEWLKENREQLWAEAAQLEFEGHNHWFVESEVVEQASEEQREREQGDIWEDKIMDYVKGKNTIKTPDIMENALFIPIKDHSRRDQMRVASVLRRHGWTRHVAKDEGRSIKEWRGPTYTPEAIVVVEEKVGEDSRW